MRLLRRLLEALKREVLQSGSDSQYIVGLLVARTCTVLAGA